MFSSVRLKAWASRTPVISSCNLGGDAAGRLAGTAERIPGPAGEGDVVSSIAGMIRKQASASSHSSTSIAIDDTGKTEHRPEQLGDALADELVDAYRRRWRRG